MPTVPRPPRGRLRGCAGLLGTATLGVVLLAGPAGAQETPAPSAAPVASPSSGPLVPLPDPSSTEPAPDEPSPTAAPVPSRSPSPLATRRARRSPSPSPSSLPSPSPSLLLPSPSGLPTPSTAAVLSPPPPLDVGLGEPVASASPAAAARPVDPPVDPLARGLKTAVGGALLLGALGVAGLFATREPR